MSLIITQNDILFSNITKSGATTGNRRSNVVYTKKDGGALPARPGTEDIEIAQTTPFINVIDVDWNGAKIKDGTIEKATLNTTGEMLSILQTAYNYATTYNVKYDEGKLYDDKGTEIKVGSQLTGATITTLGGIKTKYHTTGNAAIVDTSSTTVTNRNYGIETDGAYLGFVKVPWTDTDTKVTSVDNHYKGSLGAKSSGLYKVAFDAAGHITGATSVVKSDITALGIPGSDTNTDTKVTSVDNHYKGSLGAKSSGLYKVAFDAAGHITGATSVVKSDITALGIPGSDTNTDTKVTSVDNHYKGSLGAKSSGLYKVAFDAAGHITSVANVTSDDIIKLIGDYLNANYQKLKDVQISIPTSITRTKTSTVTSISKTGGSFSPTTIKVGAKSNITAPSSVTVTYSLKDTTDIVTISGADSVNQTPIVTSSNQNVIAVSGTTLTAKAEGKSTITVVCNGVTKEQEVSVSNASNTSKITSGWTYSSGNTNVATINSNNEIEGKSAGETTIYVKYGEKTASLGKITVESVANYYWYVGNDNPMDNGMATNIDASALTFTLNKSHTLLQTATSYNDLINKEFSFPNHFVIPTEWLNKIQIVNMSNMPWAWDTTVTDSTNKYTWCWNSGTGTGTFKIIAK